MRILFLQDLDPFAHISGAESTDRVLLQEGFRRGHEIDLALPQGFDPGTLKAEYDLALLSNVTGFPLEPLHRGLTASRVPWAMFVHDYPCKWRLFFPLAEKCKWCPYLPAWRRLFDGSSLNVMMSPLHRDALFSVMPELSAMPHALCPSLFTSPLPEAGEKVPGTVVGSNCLLPYKGRANALAYAASHPELNFAFTGASEGEGELPGNVRYLGQVSQAALDKLYADSESFLELPATPQPSERTCIHGRLAGCRMIVNRLVGIASYVEWGLPEAEFKAWLLSQASRVWERIEEAALG